MLAIRNNLMSMNAARNLGTNYDNLSTSVERLSSGLRINSAKDDAAGLAVRELIRADVAALNQGVRNANDGVSMLQAAEGALGEIDGILIRMKELVEQANTGTYSTTQTDIMQAEYDELCDEIDRIATSTDFNDNTLLDNTADVIISLGQGNGTATEVVTVTGQDMQSDALALSASKRTAVGPTVASATSAFLVD
ncbi:MAG: flagellin, partial [Phycisphaerae bacterium]|nr:flagellin [Phycisphaerae bacterium]